jgi:hypothetical protein
MKKVQADLTNRLDIYKYRLALFLNHNFVWFVCIRIYRESGGFYENKILHLIVIKNICCATYIGRN